MITKIVSADKIANQYASEVRLVGLSTDTKPVDVTNATEFEEMDTGDVYIFDADGAQWLKKKDNVGGGLPSVSESDNGKIAIVADGAWAASVNQVEISSDYDPATGILTQRQDADVPTANELNTAFSCNGAVKMRVFVNDNEVEGVYLYPYGDEVGAHLFGTVLRNRNEDYDESINVSFSVNDDDEVAFTVDRSKTPKGRFIVELTPTALDYSGTMDKTVAEIDAAYKAGQQVVFRVVTGATTYMEVDCTARWKGGDTYPSFNGFILVTDNGGALIYAWTGATNDGTQQTYYTNIFTLTPAT